MIHGNPTGTYDPILEPFPFSNEVLQPRYALPFEESPSDTLCAGAVEFPAEHGIDFRTFAGEGDSDLYSIKDNFIRRRME